MLLLHHALLPRPMAGAGDLVLVEMKTAFPGTHTPSRIWRTRRELHPQPSRRQRVAPLIELRVQMVGSGGNAPLVTSDFVFVTPDLQSGGRITSLENW